MHRHNTHNPLSLAKLLGFCLGEVLWCVESEAAHDMAVEGAQIEW